MLQPVNYRPVGNTVDVKNASYTNTIGNAELSGVWTDPDFDPAVPSCYYIRVLEIPVPRWSTYDAKTLGVDVHQELLLPFRSVPGLLPSGIRQKRLGSLFIIYPPTQTVKRTVKMISRKMGRTEGPELITLIRL